MQLATQISRRTRRGDARPAPEDLRASERLRAQTSVGCPHCGTEQAW